MSQTKCPSCGFGFDNHRPTGVEGLRGRLLFGPERLITRARADASAFDTCPNCANRFVAAEVQFLGDLARAKLRSMGAVYAVVILLIVFLAAVIWMTGR